MRRESQDSLPTPEEYLYRKSPDLATLRIASDEADGLHYPGAGTDCGPFELFARHSTVSVFVYCDYAITKEGALTFLKDLPGFRAKAMHELSPMQFGTSDWASFWPSSQEFGISQGPETAFAIAATLVSESGRRVFFVYLRTEGSQSIVPLVNSGFRPTVVVLQDHGFGGNWGQNRFGGEDSLLYRNLLITESRPRLLFVAENTDPWPGFECATVGKAYPGQESQHRRMLYEIPPDQGQSGSDRTVSGSQPRFAQLVHRELRSGA